jgi:Uma2 family endonuclease
MQIKDLVTPNEYLILERQAPYKSEYRDGQIVAMSGASRQHNIITANVVAELHAQLKQRSCTVLPSDMRVKVTSTGLYTYPDVVVVCGEALFDDNQQDTLLNPTLIVEVLSKSTEAYDRGDKFKHYRHLPSLAEYLLISQDKPGR